MITSRTLSPLDCQLQLPNRRKILAIYALTLLMYTVASPDPHPYRRGGGQLPNPNECNSTLTSETKNIYPYPTDVNDRGHPLRSGSLLQIGVTGYELSLCSDLIQHVVIPSLVLDTKLFPWIRVIRAPHKINSMYR